MTIYHVALYHFAISILILIVVFGIMAVFFLVSRFLADAQSDHLIRKTDPEILGPGPIIPQPCPEHRVLKFLSRSRAR